MNRLKFRLSDSTKVFISAFSASILFVSNVGCISMLEGPSMLPTFNVAGDLVMVDKLFYKYKPLELGQVYVYISPQNPNRLVVKRLIGKPGDVVYIDPMQGTEKLRVWDINQVPEGHIWTCGDNYDMSNDSRAYGPVSMGLLRGKIVCQVLDF